MDITSSLREWRVQEAGRMRLIRPMPLYPVTRYSSSNLTDLYYLPGEYSGGIVLKADSFQNPNRTQTVYFLHC